MKPSFSAAARAAASAARKLRHGALADNFGKPAAYATRLGSGSFGWEIRLYGGVVLMTSEHMFDSLEGARSAGAIALSAFDNAGLTPSARSIERACS